MKETAYDCKNCEWPASEDDLTTSIHGTDARPEHIRVGDTQITRCPSCKETFSTRSNTARGI